MRQFLMLRDQWQTRMKIWQGLDNFRQMLRSLLPFNFKDINQSTFDLLFPNLAFEFKMNKKEFLKNQIQQELKKINEQNPFYQELQVQLNELNLLQDELVFTKHAQDFSYEFVLRDSPSMILPSGFVKIMNLDQIGHKALLTWQSDSRDPLIFLAETINNIDFYFHINLGDNDALILLEEIFDGYCWTQANSKYPAILDAEYGSIIFDKSDNSIKLQDGNITAAQALLKAETKTKEGITVFENNIQLMKMYKADLQKLDWFKNV